MSDGDFFKGLIFGVAVGAAAGVLLAPKSGEETREDLKKFALELGDKAQDYYLIARKEVESKVKDLKKAGNRINYAEYKKLVTRVVEEIKRDGMVTAEAAKRIGMQLNEDWTEVKETLSI